MAQEQQETSGGDQSYFDDAIVGQGLEGFTAETLAAAYLSMVQPDSAASATHEVGTWRNSATDENYTNVVRVVPLAFKTVWTERDKDTFMTVGRYDPHSIEVHVEYPKPGQRGFPKMTNPTSGNKVEELFIYALTLHEHPESGILYFSPTVSSMKTCKTWNTLIRGVKVNGKPGSIFACKWDLCLETVPNPVRPTSKIVKFAKVINAGYTGKEYFLNTVQPQLALAKNIQLLAAPEQSGDVEEA